MIWSNFAKQLRIATLLAGTVLLAGCASQWRANVTTYQQWPADATGERYRIFPDTAQAAGNLEYQTVANTVHAHMGATGLVQATGDEAARFNVHLHYKTTETEVWTQRYTDGVYPWFSPYFGFYGPHFGWGGHLWFQPTLVTVPVSVNKNTLALTITDTRNQNAEVYRATAEHLGQQTHLIAIVPYLAKALFDDFPGSNGHVRQVAYPATE